MSKKMADNFVGVYPVSKTLRFELKPIGKTLEYIERDGVIDTDFLRSQNYIKVKKLIDEYHKAFIQKVLEKTALVGLEEYVSFYNLAKRTESEEKSFGICQENLRKQISKALKNAPEFATINKKELITKDLIDFYAHDQESLSLISSFSDFTTYFTGFHENRQNMYSDEPKSTAIAYRIVHQNLPKYIDNMKVFGLISRTDICNQMISLEERLAQEYNDFGTINDYFSISGFNSVLTQTGIDRYNTILGGFSTEDGEKVQGLNELINLYSQKNKEKLPKFKLLFKQILSDRDSLSFIPDQFDSDREVFDAISEMFGTLREEIFENEDQMTVGKLFEDMSAYDLNGVYISNDSAITTISQELFGDWAVLKRALIEDYEKKNPIGRTKPEKYEKKRASNLKKNSCYAIGFLDDISRDSSNGTKIESYFEKKVVEGLSNISAAYKEYERLNKEKYETGKSLKGNDRDVSVIKAFLDSVKELQWSIKPLAAGMEEASKDEVFYGEFARIWNSLEIITPLYNKIRNYVTGKPYTTEKIKLNFGRSTLLNGWDKNKERDNLGILLKREGNYYLGIMNRRDTTCINRAPEASSSDVYEKMNYKLLPGPNKMLPKVFFSKSRISEFNPSPEVVRKYKAGTHKKGEAFNLNDCRNLINFFKESIEKHEDWGQFGFHFSDTEKYQEISDFYKEVSQQGYKITFTNIDASYIDQLVENGELYLFQIYNKDFSSYSTGTPNLHTLYWKALFAAENLSDVVYKLNGEAEVFFRKASIKQENVIVHPANIEILNKDPLNSKEKSLFDYDIVKDRRYTCDKFLFHVPITMNFKAEGERYMNQRVNHTLHSAENIHIIGVDRGERNLLYISVIDMEGNIVEQMSLNEILSYDSQQNLHRRNYQMMLAEREKANITSRQNWSTINTIKELKEGYLSQVIHVITELMIKYNAIVVLEDLNDRFKRGRQKFERQVYQKFEKMLIDKLNYYVDKKKGACEDGGLLRAYQLTDKFTSFQTLGKQSGFLFYVPAWNTSKIDPTTGFVNLFMTKYESIEKSKAFIRNMDRIWYDQEQSTFAFAFDYNNFTYKGEGTETKWTIYTYGRRIDHFRNPDKNNQWDTREVQLTEALTELLNEYGINTESNNLKQDILNIDNADFFRRLMKIISLTVQMRNSDEERGIDEIVSPVKNSKGEFFVSGNIEGQPLDADANGAYNIAKKGLWVVRKIQETPEDELSGVKLAMSNKEWLTFAQENTL